MDKTAAARRVNGLRVKSVWPLLYKILVYVLLIDVAFVFLFPFLYMLATSFKSYNDLLNVTVKWFPRELSPENWGTAFGAMQLGFGGKDFSFDHPLINSLTVTLLATLGHLLTCSFVGYGLARYKFPGSNLIFMLVVFTIIVPVQTIIIPVFLMFSNLGWINTHLPLIVPTFFGFGLKGGLFIFLFRQTYLRLPKALEEAAEIDGCNPFRTYFRIVMPTAGPTFLVSAVLSVVWHWNDYFEPSIYLWDKGYLLPQMLPRMLDTIKMMQNSMSEDMYKLQTTFHEGVVMAGAAMAILPLIVFFLIIQRKFMQSVERSGIVE